MANPRPTPKPGNLGPQTSLTRCTFPVLYPVLAPERGPEWQTHARRRNLGRVLRARGGAGVGSGARSRAGLPAFVGRVHEVRILILIVLLILFLILLFFGDTALRVPSRGVAEDPGHPNLKMKRPGPERPPVLTSSQGT